jgi:hypothetical protein
MLPCGYTYFDGDDVAEEYHLHIIASNPDKEGLVVVVSVSSMFRWADKTVVLKAGDHGRVTHESYVAYNFAKLQKVTEIEARLARLPKLVKETCSEALLKRVQFGLLESEQTENGVKHFFREVHPDD